MITKEIVEQLNLPIEDYYICYFDILGYKAFFENDQNEHKKFLAEILFAIGDVESEIRKKKPKLKVEIRTFSDNFLLFFKKEDKHQLFCLKTLCEIVQKIQVRLLMNFGMLVRGGITVGEFFANENIVFGEGLIKAVVLEEKIAKNPRVVIDKEVFKEELDELLDLKLIVKDNDECYFVNYLGNDGFLLSTKGKCEALINKYGKYHYLVKDESKIILTERTITKYIWLLIYFNSQCESLNRKELKIDYHLKLNERILKLEVFVGKN